MHFVIQNLKQKSYSLTTSIVYHGLGYYFEKKPRARQSTRFDTQFFGGKNRENYTGKSKSSNPSTMKRISVLSFQLVALNHCLAVLFQGLIFSRCKNNKTSRQWYHSQSTMPAAEIFTIGKEAKNCERPSGSC